MNDAAKKYKPLQKATVFHTVKYYPDYFIRNLMYNNEKR